MTTEYLERQLENWKKVLLLFLGAATTLAATTVGFTGHLSVSFGWVTFWIVLQLGAAPAGLLLLFGREWRKLPLSQRLNTAFGYLAAVWLCWLAIGFGMTGDTPSGIVFVTFIGGLFGIAYVSIVRTSCAVFRRSANRANSHDIVRDFA